jgi:hypothetical protein
MRMDEWEDFFQTLSNSFEPQSILFSDSLAESKDSSYIDREIANQSRMDTSTIMKI